MQGTKRAPKSKAIELSDEENDLQSRLIAFGFVVPDDTIRGWTDEQDDVLACLDQWELDQRIVSRGEAIDSRERTPVPEFLKGFEQVTPQQIITASEQGKKAAEDIDQTSEHNPYPIDTALAAAWDDALANNVIKPDETPKPVAKIELAQQQRAVIEDLQAQIEATLIHQREVRQEWDRRKEAASTAKKQFDGIVADLEELSVKLEDARNGKLPAQRSFPFPEDTVDAQTPQRDEGAFVSLDYLTKGQLQEFIPGTPEDRGISQRQADLLKSAVGGNEAIGDLEKFINDKGDWWHKEISDIGKETRGKIEDALYVIRKKFPVPDANEPVTLRVTGYSPGTIGRLSDLVKLCNEVIDSDNTEDQNATSFCESVAQQAAGMRYRIAKGEELSAAMEAAIENWETAVEKWREGQE